jgi:HSP20 family molecular chaperone IbpA
LPDKFNPWEFFQNQFVNKNGEMRSGDDFSNRDFSWIEDYVKGTLMNAIPEQMGDLKTQSTRVKHQVFEAHHYMIVRIDLPDDVSAEDVKVFLNTNELKVQAGEEDVTKTINLPVNGSYKGSEALYKDSVLEIRIPKKNNDTFHEIPVQY